MTMHFARIDKSTKLQALLAFLQAKGTAGTTTLEIDEHMRSLGAIIQSVSTWVSMLRANGYEIICKYERTTDAGAKVYRYTILGELRQREMFA